MRLSLAVVTIVTFVAMSYLPSIVESRSVYRWPCWWGLGPEIPPSWLRHARRNDSSSSDGKGTEDVIRSFNLLPMIVPDWLCDLRYNRSLPELNVTDSSDSK
ncbi:AAEL004597-PA [Aedes aegypti]|uniref:AAEL004597-PA n=2 Tax=Aedes aegypti TaxID=7159 RepID=Q1I1B6_AEDAE|nr:putative 8.9 kDa secreted protein [Aedes aegypti]AAY41835.1 putative secreted protein precursor [Aedes aegypti]EAT44007.1 AAEL004597-PA [Aedes aegypti]